MLRNLLVNVDKKNVQHKLEIRPRARGTEVHFPELLRSAHRPLT